MSNFLHKSHQNAAACSILIDQGQYNPSVHCAYYRCFQHVLHLQSVGLGLSRGDDWSQGAHNDLINKMRDGIKATHPSLSLEFNNSMQQLKTLRRRADYESQLFDAGTSRDVQRLATSIVQLLQRVFDQ